MAVLDLINCVCFKLGIPKKISSLKEANVNLIKECFVKLCAAGKFSEFYFCYKYGLTLKKRKINANSGDKFLDDLTTIKKILNTLSFSLGVSLAHIEPPLIISCNETALNDLFEVFSELISSEMNTIPSAFYITYIHILKNFSQDAISNGKNNCDREWYFLIFPLKILESIYSPLENDFQTSCI